MASMFETPPKPTPKAESFSGPDLVEQSTIHLLLAFIIVGSMVCIQFITGRKVANFPLINPARGIELFDKARRKHFVLHPKELLEKGRVQSKGKPFNLMTDAGEVTILPPSMVNDIRNEKGLDFMAIVAEDFHAHIPGFESFAAGSRSDSLIQVVARKQLTKFLNKVTKPLSEEASFATELAFGSSGEWREIHPHYPALDLVARLSSRVFLGEELCRNQEWLDITKSYTVSAFIAANKLRVYPNWMRNIVHWFDPRCKQLRTQVARAREILNPVIDKRESLKKAALDSGSPVPMFDDALDWYQQESQGRPYDAAIEQLILSTAAIHTTTDLTAETLLRLSQDPSLVTELRQEITTILRAEGWKKTSLYNMKLLDSVLKETQRLKPISIVSMQRKALADVKLPTGQIIPKGARTVCSIDLMLSPEEYSTHLNSMGIVSLTGVVLERIIARISCRLGPRASVSAMASMHVLGDSLLQMRSKLRCVT